MQTVEQPPPEICTRWRVSPLEYLGGRRNQHWLVESAAGRLVVRGYWAEAWPDVAYELEVQRQLKVMGWPVPTAVEEPLSLEGRIWCLFTWLPGEPLASPDLAAERRVRGRLLAELHDSTARITGLGQREGFWRSDEFVRDPELLSSIQSYERVRPVEGHILRWHLTEAQQMFARASIEGVETLVLHSDFAPWNLLFQDGQLTGILDFEATHLNFRVADFALAWRGDQDEVISGYEEVHKLTDADWSRLVPTYWAWLFLGVKKAIQAMEAGGPEPSFDWEIKHLLKRTGMIGRMASPYSGLR